MPCLIHPGLIMTDYESCVGAPMILTLKKPQVLPEAYVILESVLNYAPFSFDVLPAKHSEKSWLESLGRIWGRIRNIRVIVILKVIPAKMTFCRIRKNPG